MSSVRPVSRSRGGSRTHRYIRCARPPMARRGGPAELPPGAAHERHHGAHARDRMLRGLPDGAGADDCRHACLRAWGRAARGLAAAVCAAVRSRWEMFIFSEDVKVEDRSASTAELGVYGPRAAEAVAPAFATAGLPGSLPSATLMSMPLLACTTVPVDGGSAIVLRSDEPGVAGFDLVVPVDARNGSPRRSRRTGPSSWTPTPWKRGEWNPDVRGSAVDMTDDTIPLEAGIEDRAISLTKGCYVGQEIIIRVLHRGHGRVARRLVGLSFAASDQPPAPRRHDPCRRSRSRSRHERSVVTGAPSPNRARLRAP